MDSKELHIRSIRLKVLKPDCRIKFRVSLSVSRGYKWNQERYILGFITNRLRIRKIDTVIPYKDNNKF